jgi:hypothetical protein
MPKIHFLAPHPKFGRAGNRLPVIHQQRSPYYWWWAYLRKNEDYLKCCEEGGKGKLSGLYADFGDVREDDFHGWWTSEQRGARLFGERALDVRFGELTSTDQWHPSWTQEQVMIVAVPLRESNRSLKGRFAALLDTRLQRSRGRPAMSAITSTAQYKLARNYDTRHLENALIAFDLWMAEQPKPSKERKTLWEIGVEMKISREKAADAISKNKGARLLARNYLGAVVKRYITQAKTIIENTTQGQFPASSQQ